jgi:hypothetical protein
MAFRLELDETVERSRVAYEAPADREEPGRRAAGEENLTGEARPH